MPTLPVIIALSIGVLLAVYILTFTMLQARVVRAEQKIVNIFVRKLSKIPALIEVMRPFVADQKVFDSITALHMHAMTQKFDSIYSMLALNTRIEKDYAFLMKISVQIAKLQKNEQFLYIRDFIMKYEREMRSEFAGYNEAAIAWNRFVRTKNATIIGYILPGEKRDVLA